MNATRTPKWTGLVWLAAMATMACGQSRPQILQQPQGLIVPRGTTVSFTVVVTNDPPLAYRWRRGGTTLPGQTNATLVVTNATVSAVYTVVVTNRYGAVGSERAPLGFFEFSRETNGLALDMFLPVTQPTPLYYQLQCTTNLLAPDWLTLTNVESCGCVVRYLDPLRGGEALRVYRAASQP